MLPVNLAPIIKKFYCFDCESRFEEEVYDEIGQEFFCLNCKSFNILPFAESAMGQHGCGAEECKRRINLEEGCVDCSGCEYGCVSNRGKI